MAIIFKEDEQIFHLQSEEISYVLKILDNGQLGHVYWGKRINHNCNLSRLIRKEEKPFEPHVLPEDQSFILDIIPQEYPAYGKTDFRYPAYHIQLENGSTITDLKYVSHEIIKGKEKLAGLPATYVEENEEAETLKIKLYDETAKLEVVLIYTIFKDYPVVTRSVHFSNKDEKNLTILRALSMSVDYPDDDYQLLQLSGAWARERGIVKRQLTEGTVSIDSKRGASSHQQNPFIALLQGNADEYQGDVFGFSLVYSGNFLAQVEVNHYHQTRVSMGINPFDFKWQLEPGGSFQTPEVVMVYSDSGLNKMSQVYHQLYRERLARGKYRNQLRPILINNWEATYFNFNDEKIINMAREAKELGIELFVLDDGWFGERDDDTSSLGDWVIDEKKLPRGLKYLVDKINEIGLKFGLWFEPEMVSPDSQLYRKHPDWCIHVADRDRSLSRSQLILDLSRKEVCNYIIDSVSKILESASISYVKWDMNRHMTEIGSATLPSSKQKETTHRYMLGLYYVLEEITNRFPDVLFESCSGGGGRYDPGMLYYMPQTWTSDNTDAVERLKIQYGTSIVYPASSMGAHVSAVPNHQVGRITSLEMRGNVAMFGNFGYELDITALSQEEKNIVKKQIEAYKKVRELIQYGEFYRLSSPFTGNETAWMSVSADQDEAFVGYYRSLAESNPPFYKIKLKGLDPAKSYQDLNTGETYGGDELMFAGLTIPTLHGDFQSVVWRLRSLQF